jgi:tetratricopeptide (TPR) repeat protein
MFPPGQNGDNDTDRKLTSQTWSLSEHLAQEVNSAWLAVKDAGNEHLKAGRYSEAIDCYGEAEKITRSDRTSFYALMEDFEDLDADSPQRRFQECEDVQDEVDGYLRQDAPGAEHSGFPDFHVMLPNLPAAVCLANRSAALLRAAKEGVLVRVCGAWSCEASELHAMALADAQRATEVCPEYVKAHHRVASAHTALGNVAEAAQEHCALKEYALLHGRLPLGSAALMACGWVDIACHTVVYVEREDDAAAAAPTSTTAAAELR